MNNYFSHDYYSRCNPKLQSVLMKRGLEGIGLYWCVVEMLYENQGYLSLDDIERIAFELRCPDDIVNDIIHNYNLFVVKDKRFFSKGVMKRLKLRKLKSEQARENVSKRWSKHKENQEVEKDTNVKQTYNEANTKKKMKNKKNEININEKEKVLDFDTNNSIPSLTEVEDFFLKNSTTDEAKKFFYYYESIGWKVGKNPLKNWKAAASSWIIRNNNGENNYEKFETINSNRKGTASAWKREWRNFDEMVKHLEKQSSSRDEYL